MSGNIGRRRICQARPGISPCRRRICPLILNLLKDERNERRPAAYSSAHPELVEGRGDEYAIPYHIAASTAPGVAGSLVIGWPMAWEMAAPMAGSGGTIGTSPTPRTP